MFADYTSQVLLDYQRKRATNALSLRLIHATPAKLKAECIAACEERYLRKDEMALKAFFGQGGDRAACLQAIKRCETDKFKPLVNFLRESTGNTEEKNIELLAWLIDFGNRPYILGNNYDSSILRDPDIKLERLQENCDKEDDVRTKQPDQDEEKTTFLHPVSGRPAAKFKIRSAILVGAILISIGIVTYWIWSNRKSTVALTGREACMYWTGDHYQEVSCNEKLGDTLVVALDSDRLNHFKRITQPDTISQRSKGMVWYVKVNGSIEFYTSDGYHPMDRQLRLRPVTDYIIRKYIHSDLDSERTSQ